MNDLRLNPFPSFLFALALVQGCGSSDPGTTHEQAPVEQGSAAQKAAEHDDDAGATCPTPAAAHTYVEASGSGCRPKPTFELCNAATSSCTNACAANEYALTCSGSPQIPAPDASLHCKAIAIPTPSSSLFYCCPCGA